MHLKPLLVVRHYPSRTVLLLCHSLNISITHVVLYLVDAGIAFSINIFSSLSVLSGRKIIGPFSFISEQKQWPTTGKVLENLKCKKHPTINVTLPWENIIQSKIIYTCVHLWSYLNNSSSCPTGISKHSKTINKNTRPSASCFHTLFSHVWISQWNTRSRCSNIT